MQRLLARLNAGYAHTRRCEKFAGCHPSTLPPSPTDRASSGTSEAPPARATTKRRTVPTSRQILKRLDRPMLRSRWDEQASVGDNGLVVELDGGTEHHAVEVHACDVDAAQARARAERE